MFLLASILTRIQDLMSTWGYPVLFGLLFSCGLGVPLPEDIPLLLAGYFIANGKMNLFIASIAAWCGIVAGDCVLYSFGRRYGLGITRIPVIGKEVTAERIKWAEGYFQRHGILVVAVGRLFAGVRGVMVITAGTIRFNFVPFIIADGLAAIVSGGLFMSLGYWAGRKLGDLESLREKISHYEHRVLGGVIVIAILVGFWVWWRSEKKDKPVEIVSTEPSTPAVAESAPQNPTA